MKNTSFATFSSRNGLFKPSSGISSNATVIDVSCSIPSMSDIHKLKIEDPTTREGNYRGKKDAVT